MKTPAERKLEAARLRVLACQQRQNAAAHERQAGQPIYPGQTMICLGKAAMLYALAARRKRRQRC